MRDLKRRLRIVVFTALCLVMAITQPADALVEPSSEASVLAATETPATAALEKDTSIPIAPPESTEQMSRAQEAAPPITQPAAAASVATPTPQTSQPLAAPAPPAPAAAPLATLPSPVVSDDDVVVSAFAFRQGVGFDFIELRNTSSSYVTLSNVEIHLLYSSQSSDYECQITPRGYIRPNSYVTFAQGSVTASGAYEMSGCPSPGGGLFDKEIQVYRAGMLVESVRISAGDMAAQNLRQWERKGWTATYRSGVLAKDFGISARAVYTSQLYEPPSAPTIEFLEVLPNAELCAPLANELLCRPYVKLKNTGAEPVNLAEFRLRSGDPNSRPSSYNTSSLAGVVQPGEYLLVNASADAQPLAIDKEDGAIWLDDAVGLATYASNLSPYHDAELVANKNRSWALDSSDKVWKWATPSPISEQNDFSVPGMGAGQDPTSSADELKPCAPNQYRSEETNRCRVISSDNDGLTPCREGQYRSLETNRCRNSVGAMASLKPCRDDQYRSEETNRCRSIASTAAATLKPCADDQFRNPSTGRCKKIASTEDTLKPCDPGEERNPATNRCRKIITSTPPAAAFAPEIVKDGAKAFMAWWALGGLVLLGAGWTAWEYRFEMKRWLSQIRPGGGN